jgi:hypothetical protein
MKNPIQLKNLSPLLVTATPDEIMRTIRSSLREGSLMRVAHVMSRIATGVKACVDVSMGRSKGVRERNDVKHVTTRIVARERR